ncbi:MAG: exonuclease subunit SbcD [Chthoniobacterales bacterium]|nr:exonuclease subunit SbcD [Chthoniobacterales bacterium]
MQSLPPKSSGSYRILHTADWHLGKLLNDQSRDEEHERFLEWLLALATEAAAHAILVAGDIFDSANPPQSALSRYYNFVSGLNLALRVPVRAP